jgi:hypothetical protein
MCSAIRRRLNKKTRKDTQMTFYKIMAVPTFTHGSEIWNETEKKGMEKKLKPQR